MLNQISASLSCSKKFMKAFRDCLVSTMCFTNVQYLFSFGICSRLTYILYSCNDINPTLFTAWYVHNIIPTVPA